MRKHSMSISAAVVAAFVAMVGSRLALRRRGSVSEHWRRAYGI